MKRLTAVRPFLAVAAAVTLSGCATKGDIRSLQMEVADEIRTIAARQDSLMMAIRRETMSTQDTLRTQSDQLFDFRGDITQELRSISQSLTRLEALVGQNQQAISRLGGRGGGGLVTQAAPPDSSGFSLSDAESVSGVEGGVREAYQAAREAHQRGSYSTAMRAYRDVLSQDPNGELAPDAQFYLADILEQQGDLEEALDAFQAVPSRWPTAGRVPEALYRVAVIQRGMGDVDEARATLQRIVNSYPNALITSSAQALLDELG